jgi:NDP-sugar pyrophosphorylase family protein
MIFVFPMAGQGIRTRALGECKPLIEVAGQPMIQWALTGFRHHVRPGDSFVFVTTRYFEEKFSVKKRLKEILRELGLTHSADVILCEERPAGPADTVRKAGQLLDVGEPCTVVNSDQYIVCDLRRDLGSEDGLLPVYFNDSPESSYARIEAGLVTEIREKQVISNHASAGVYVFGSGHGLLRSIESTMKSDCHHRGEYYVGPAMNELIRRGGRVYPARTLAKFDLGNEAGISLFEGLSPDIRFEPIVASASQRSSAAEKRSP